MSTDSKQPTVEQLTRAYEMQRKAREKADQLLEEKSRELYLKNESLKDALEKLNKQQAQLITQEKLASVGQLGASLAHELNNPNAFIQNNVVTLEDYVTRLGEGLDDLFELFDEPLGQATGEDAREALRARLKQIRKQSDLDFIKEDMPGLMKDTLDGTKRINSIANGLRYFANPDVSSRKQLDVNECIRQAQQLVRQNDRLAGIRFELGEVSITMGLPMLLSQAIANLLQNAIEADPAHSEICVRSYQNKETIYIDVLDRGAGISPEQLSEVFKPFYTTKQSKNGLGLGMAKQIVDQHSGQIELISNDDRGTCARVSLPVIDVVDH